MYHLCLLSSNILCCRSIHMFRLNRTFFVLSALSMACFLHRYIGRILLVIFEIPIPFPIIGVGRKQLWRMLITYSISQQPVWRIKIGQSKSRIGRKKNWRPVIRQWLPLYRHLPAMDGTVSIARMKTALNVGKTTGFSTFNCRWK